MRGKYSTKLQDYHCIHL